MHSNTEPNRCVVECFQLLFSPLDFAFADVVVCIQIQSPIIVILGVLNFSFLILIFIFADVVVCIQIALLKTLLNFLSHLGFCFR